MIMPRRCRRCFDLKTSSSLPLLDDSNRIIRNTFNASMVAYIISSLTSSIGSLIDGVIIGQFLGVDSMAAFGLVSPIVIVFSLFGAVIASGARNRFTMMIGNGDLEGAKGIFSLSVVIGVGLSTVMMLAVFAFSTPLCVLLGATGSAADLLDQSRDYLIGIAFGLPAMNASRIISSYMSIDNDRQLPVISSLVLTLVDIVLDVLIAVMGGRTFGMGLATSISHYAGLAVLLLHFRRSDRLLHFSFSTIHWQETGSMINRGLPTGVGRVSNTVRTVILNRMLAAVATAGCIAAYSVHRQADSLLNPFIFGVSDTVIVLTGLLIAEENRPMIRRLLQNSVALVCTGVVAISVLFWMMSPLFAAFFIKDDPEALIYGIRAARCYAVGMPLYALNHVIKGYMEGKGKINTVLFCSFLSEGGYLVLSAAVLLPFYQADAIWYAFPVSQVLLMMTLAVITMLQNQKGKAHPSDFWDWLSALPADFDVPEEDRIDRTISSHEEVIALSKAAWTFCDAHGCDQKRKYAISLAVEELATNTVMTGFRPHHHNTIDMRILKKGNDYIVRIRDDCEIFDPVRQLQLYDRNVPAHHLGLRMAIGSARDVQYTTMLKLNNLTLRV